MDAQVLQIKLDERRHIKVFLSSCNKEGPTQQQQQHFNMCKKEIETELTTAQLSSALLDM